MLTLIRTPHNYVQGADALYEFYANVKHLGKNFLFVCSKSGMKSTREKIEKSCEGQDVTLVFEVFNGISSKSEIARMQEIIRANNIDVVVGVGGGSAIDTAKASAYYENKKIVIVPTVSATDAPCTGLSVIYDDEGTVDSYLFYPTNPDVIIADSSVLVKAPIRFLVAGMGDALGTYFEARMCHKGKAPSLEGGGIAYTTMALCEFCYKTLLEHGPKAKIAAEMGLLTPDVEAVIEANTFLSGVGGDNGNVAAAHSIYNGLTALEELTGMHGEAVAFGTLVQLILEGAPSKEFYEVLEFCHTVGLPITLGDMGVSTDVDRLRIAAEAACKPGENIHYMIGDVTPDELIQAMLTTDALGKAYRAK